MKTAELRYKEKMSIHKDAIKFIENMYGINETDFETSLNPLHYLDALKKYYSQFPVLADKMTKREREMCNNEISFKLLRWAWLQDSDDLFMVVYNLITKYGRDYHPVRGEIEWRGDEAYCNNEYIGCIWESEIHQSGWEWEMPLKAKNSSGYVHSRPEAKEAVIKAFDEFLDVIYGKE